MINEDLKAKQENLDKLQVAYNVIRDLMLDSDLSYSEIECFEIVKNHIANEIAYAGYEVTFSPANVKLVTNE